MSLFGIKKKDETIVKCSSCRKESTADEWNKSTLSYDGVNRRMKRHFIGIGKEMSEQRWYICPKCNTKKQFLGLKNCD